MFAPDALTLLLPSHQLVFRCQSAGDPLHVLVEVETAAFDGHASTTSASRIGSSDPVDSTRDFGGSAPAIRARASM